MPKFNFSIKVCFAFIIFSILTSSDVISLHSVATNAIELYSSHENEDVKLTVATLLGSIASKCPEKYVNVILNSLSSEQMIDQGLCSLHEYLRLSAGKQSLEKVLALWNNVTGLCQSAISAGTERLVSDCLGVMASFSPDVLPSLKQALKNPSKTLRICALNAIRYNISSGPLSRNELEKLALESVSLVNDGEKVCPFTPQRS
jgi:hypothetical protein